MRWVVFSIHTYTSLQSIAVDRHFLKQATQLHESDEDMILHRNRTGRWPHWARSTWQTLYEDNGSPGLRTFRLGKQLNTRPWRIRLTQRILSDAVLAMQDEGWKNSFSLENLSSPFHQLLQGTKSAKLIFPAGLALTALWTWNSHCAPSSRHFESIC